MTIAIGFHFDRGILLCADSQYTLGITKLKGKKLFPKKIGDERVIFAISGAVPYAKGAIEKFTSEISNVSASDRSCAKVKEVLENVLIEHHQRHIFPHPDRGRMGGPDYDLLVAVFSHLDGLSFFSTSGTSVNDVPQYYCTGIGSDLAYFLTEGIYRHVKMPLKDIVNIAIHILKETKEWVEFCGGKSQFAVLHNDGEISAVRSLDIETSEEISRGFREAIRRLYVVAADLDATEPQIKKELDLIGMILEGVRLKAKEERNRYASWFNSLEKGQKQS